jgi:hypothetical protein
MGNVGLGHPAPDSLQTQPLSGARPATAPTGPVTPAQTPSPATSRDVASPLLKAGQGKAAAQIPLNAGPTASQRAGDTKPKPAGPQSLHVTEFYNMSGELLDAFETTSRYSRVMVDEVAYGNYLQAKFASLNPDSPEETTTFTDGVVAALDKDEKQSGVDLVAMEKGLILSFEGEAYEKSYGTIVRQYGEGQLNVVSQFDNGKRALAASFDAVSGPMRNGLIPDGRYKVSAPVDAVNQFPDETGKFGFKMVITPLERMQRGDFRIHSVQSKAKKLMWMTEGCVGLSGGHAQNVQFNSLMLDYFRTHKSIDLQVAIQGNANVKTQLGDKPSYK